MAVYPNPSSRGITEILNNGESDTLSIQTGDGNIADGYGVDDIVVTGDTSNNGNWPDWRVKLKLAPDADYLYKDPDNKLLEPLNSDKGSDGVVFPYTPSVNVTYSANYDQTNLVHSNYRVNTYSSSSVDQVTITGEFTAQDVREARYVLAVIHFFKSLTKMFYGQDESPIAGTPPPLCYLEGYGKYQFDGHPLVVSSFTYALPNDVDYIPTVAPSVANTVVNRRPTSVSSRLGSRINPGGTAAPTKFSTAAERLEVTRVPSKIQLSVACIPIVSRNFVSNEFSFKKYADGSLNSQKDNKWGAAW